MQSAFSLREGAQDFLDREGRGTARVQNGGRGGQNGALPAKGGKLIRFIPSIPICQPGKFMQKAHPMKNIAKNIILKCSGDPAAPDALTKGYKAVADALGLDISVVYRFTYEKKVGGTGGVIPPKHMMKLMAWGKTKGIVLVMEDFAEEPKGKGRG